MTASESPGASPPPADNLGKVDLGIPGLGPATEIGRGAAGVVYRAEQPGVNRTVAVKLLPFAALDVAARQRFERECKAMGSLSSHPGIVTVYDAGFTPSGQPYIIMELMEGGSLSDRLAQRGRYSWEEATEIGIRLSGALAAAHAKGVLHRDVKPDNVLISSYGEYKLADFSIARVVGSSQTQTGLITATPAYAAPEILRGDPPTPASDIYSLASTIVTLMLGSPPFVRDTDSSIYAVMARVERDPVPDMRPLGAPDGVAWVLERAMSKDARLRQQSGEELAAELSGARSGLPAWSPPAPLDAAATRAFAPDGRAAAGRRPSRGLLIGGLAAVLLIGGGTGVVLAARHGGGTSPSSNVSARNGGNVGATGSSGSVSSAAGGGLDGLLLGSSDLPNGFSQDSSGKLELGSVTPCNVHPDVSAKTAEADAGYQNIDAANLSVTELGDSVGAFSGSGAVAYMSSLDAASRKCTTFSASSVDSSISVRSGAPLGDQAVRFDVVSMTAGAQLNSSFVLVRRGTYVALVVVSGTGTPHDNDTTADSLASKQVNKLGG